MHSRLKAAPTITLSEREMLRCSWVRTSLQEVTVVLGVNWSIEDKQIMKFNNFLNRHLPVRNGLLVNGSQRGLQTVKGESGAYVCGRSR
jgi:hypothetical protein